ncbi:MAG: hypothetical protein LQ340_001947 [Diploschistes diacapsis]|nr:MAG: hypothetical protein LQ340_001947 [Diploschistes diacapsis]
MDNTVLQRIQETLSDIQKDYKSLSASVEGINGRVNALVGVGEIRDVAASSPEADEAILHADKPTTGLSPKTIVPHLETPSTNEQHVESCQATPGATSAARSSLISRIILTTYPRQAGIEPLPMDWGHQDPTIRGPVVVSRNTSTVRRRNGAVSTNTPGSVRTDIVRVAIGAHGGSYSIYHALAVASKDLDIDHVPDFTNTEPAVKIGPFPQWVDRKKIVSLDPFGHLAPWLFKDLMQKENIDIRPTIAITKAHMKLPELEQSVRSGRIVPDGRICLNETGELAVTKFAVEPVWYLPGVAERFGIGSWCLQEDDNTKHGRAHQV